MAMLQSLEISGYSSVCLVRIFLQNGWNFKFLWEPFIKYFRPACSVFILSKSLLYNIKKEISSHLKSLAEKYDISLPSFLND